MPRKIMTPNARLREERSTRFAIGRRIANRRKALGMTQEELADAFGVSRAAISQYEVAIGDLDAGDMVFLAEILRVPVVHFFLPDDDEGSDVRDDLELLEACMPYLSEDVRRTITTLTEVEYARAIGLRVLIVQELETKKTRLESGVIKVETDSETVITIAEGVQQKLRLGQGSLVKGDPPTETEE